MTESTLPAATCSPASPAARTFASAQQILSIADLGILVADAAGLITEYNSDLCAMFGYPEPDMLGLSLYLLLPPEARARHVELTRRFIDSGASERRAPGRQELIGYRCDGSEFPLEASIALFREGERISLVVTMRDISARKLAEAELTRRATHDALTGLPNRALIRERLVGALQRSRRAGTSVALLFVDLDGFKLVNDGHGHDAGDLLLKTVAARLLEHTRGGETVGRLGGDEFVVLCEQLAPPEQAAGMALLAERIGASLRLPFDCDGQTLHVTASIGIAIGQAGSHSADDMLRYADTAMYAVKQQGRDAWQFFSEQVHAQARQRVRITTGLRTALAQQELALRFQPIVMADSGRMVGAELLLRWFPAEGEVAPSVFIPVAEMSGAIVPIGAWVFGQACRAEADWRRRWGRHAPYVSVNLSTRQLDQATLAEEFGALLRQSGADPARLLLEITETALMTDVDANVRVLRQLAQLGLRVAVDDFGTGYSSLAQLTRMPVDVLKIDRAFVDGIDRLPESRTVIRAVIGLGRALGLKMVAEGVETAAQQRELCASGCDYLQGYHFHRPMTESALIETLERELREGPSGASAPLHFLLYASRAVAPMSSAALDALLLRARAANRAAGVTGCLIYQNGHFIQMLEGQAEALQTVMAAIRADGRHTQLRVIVEGQAKSRIFADWSMALRDVTAGPELPDFSGWQRREISLMELADDARTCYAYVTGYQPAPAAR
ncbi:MAG: EAL domain-containing protein [Pseudomonadota bacterium]